MERDRQGRCDKEFREENEEKADMGERRRRRLRESGVSPIKRSEPGRIEN